MKTELLPFPRGSSTLLRAASQLALYTDYIIIYLLIEHLLKNTLNINNFGILKSRD